MRKLIILIYLIIFVSGCNFQDWPRYEFNWRTWRFERVGPKNIIKPTQTTSSTTSTTTNTQSKRGPSTKIENQPEEVKLLPKSYQKAIVETHSYRLYFVKKPTQDIPEKNVCVIRDVPLDKLCEIVSLLFPGEGPGGGKTKKFMLYHNPEVFEAAKAFAQKLNIVDSGNNWEKALNLLYKSQFPHKLPPEKRFKITSLLNAIIINNTADSDIRWASGILVATLYGRYSPIDYLAALSTLSKTSKITTLSNYQKLVINYHKIKFLYARGETNLAERLINVTTQKYKNLSNTVCFQSILDMKKK